MAGEQPSNVAYKTSSSGAYKTNSVQMKHMTSPAEDLVKSLQVTSS